MKTPLAWIAAWITTVGLFAARPVDAAVVVVENETAAKVSFTIHWPSGQDTHHALAAGEVVPIGVTGAIDVSYEADGRSHRQTLPWNRIYRFVGSGHKIELAELTMRGLGDPQARPTPSGADSRLKLPPNRVYTVPVKLAVDDQEPTTRAIWEKRLRNRLAAASAIFERHCCVRFDVVAVDTWVADRSIHNFLQSVTEFEQKVSPKPARLAIGFTGHYKWTEGEVHVGGSRGPLRPHILIREALVGVSEMERLEVLVHELGHFLGAVHAGGNSVMRPTLGDHRACVRGFRIGFDAPNTLAMYLLGEELRTRPVFALGQLPAESKVSMRRAYAWLAKTMPTDPAAPKYLALLDAAGD